jgi:hypothetical protein
LALAYAWFLLRAAVDLTARTPRWPWFVVIAAEVLSWLCLQPFSIPTGGMEDTILKIDHVFVEKVGMRLGRMPLARRHRHFPRNNVQDGELVVPAGKYFVLGDNRDFFAPQPLLGFRLRPGDHWPAHSDLRVL